MEKKFPNVKRDIENCIIPSFNDIYILFTCSNSTNDDFTCTLQSEVDLLIGRILKHDQKDIWCMFLKISNEFYIKISQNEFHFGKIYKGEAIYDMETYHRWIFIESSNNFVREWNEGFITILKKKDIDESFSLLRRFLIKKNFVTTKELSVSINKDGKQIVHSQRNIQEINAPENIINLLKNS